MGKEEILARRVRPLEEEKVEVKRSGVELSFPAPDLPTLGPHQKLPEAGSPDAGIPGHHLIDERRGDDLPGVGAQDRGTSRKSKVFVRQERAEGPFKGPP